jgi:purine-cytosine permease-like protein
MRQEGIGMNNDSIGKRRVWLPGSRVGRTILGVLLIVGGLVGFLPLLGFWMIPLGLIVLSVDFPMVRRWRRRWDVWFGGWLKKRYPRLAEKLGFRSS